MLTMWAAHTTFSDPGQHGHLVRKLPAGAAAACTAARNVIGHYGADFPAPDQERRGEVNLRLIRSILDTDQARHAATPLDAGRDPATRVAGCCRDHALFVVAVLREQGTPARTRVGFADYLIPGFRVDHVIAESWTSGHWIRTDPEMLPGAVPFDPAVMEAGPEAPFQTAAEAWQSVRSGRVSAETYRVPPGSGFTSSSHLIRVYVAFELAHRNRDELLLWDIWPALEAFDDDALVDDLAELLIAADSGDRSAEADLVTAYARLGPGDVVTQLSPFGDPPQQIRIRPLFTAG